MLKPKGIKKKYMDIEQATWDLLIIKLQYETFKKVTAIHKIGTCQCILDDENR